MRSLTYKHLIWNSTWYKKYCMPFGAAGHPAKGGVHSPAAEPRKKNRHRLSAWIKRFQHGLH